MLERISFWRAICSVGAGRAVAGGCGELLVDLIDLLLSGLIAGIDLDGVGELGEGAVEVAALAQDAAAVDVGDGGLIACAVADGLCSEGRWA